MGPMLRPGVAQGVSPSGQPLVRRNQRGRHALCGMWGLDRAMDNTYTQPADSTLRELEAELETWDWARAAGVSADELRRALTASLTGRDLRKAA